MNNRLTMREIIGSQDLHGQTLPILFRYISIPLAWPLTYVLANIGISANGATALRLGITLAAFAAIASGSAQYYPVGIAAFFASIILDNVDGQIARVRDNASYYGKFFDGVVDSIAEAGLPFFLGVYLFIAFGMADALILGAVGGLSHAMLQLVMLRYGLISAEATRGDKTRSQPHPNIRALFETVPFKWLSHFCERLLPIALWDLRIGGLLIGVLLSEELIYLIVLAAVELAALILLCTFRLVRVLPELDIHRTSASTAHPNDRYNSEC